MKQRIGMMLTALLVAFVLLFAGCAGGPEPEEEQGPQAAEPQTKRPVLLDHENYKFGKDMPDWVMMDANEIQQLDQYEDYYVFKFESPRAQSLQGAKIWTRNFEASAQLAQTVRNEVQSKFAGAAVGDTDFIETYQEQVVATFSEAQFSGYAPVADYWIEMRYFDADGDVEEDAFTYFVLYTIEKDTLDRMIQTALDQAEEEAQPETDEEERAKQRVEEAFENGLR